ncbi:MAG: uracil-DNA glycosylase family protein [Planctomycetota bacterium]
MVLEVLTRELIRPFDALRFPAPVACVYHPLDYAWDVHRRYLDRYGRGRKQVLMLGMNPGPFGMVQTGVPFGEVEAVRSWLRLVGDVRPPERQHPKRPVQGFDCTRSEISGRRLWGWAAHRFVTPGRFFRAYYVHNYCPLAFVADSGANLTPDKLPSSATRPLYELCDRLLVQTAQALRPRLVIGIGAFAEAQARRVLGGDPALRFGRIPHPSPASPLANRGWEPLVDEALAEALAQLGAAH